MAGPLKRKQEAEVDKMHKRGEDPRGDMEGNRGVDKLEEEFQDWLGETAEGWGKLRIWNGSGHRTRAGIWEAGSHNLESLPMHSGRAKGLLQLQKGGSGDKRLVSFGKGTCL